MSQNLFESNRSLVEELNRNPVSDTFKTNPDIIADQLTDEEKKMIADARVKKAQEELGKIKIDKSNLDTAVIEAEATVQEALASLTRGNTKKFNESFSKTCKMTNSGKLRATVSYKGKIGMASLPMTESQIANYNKAIKEGCGSSKKEEVDTKFEPNPSENPKVPSSEKVKASEVKKEYLQSEEPSEAKAQYHNSKMDESLKGRKFKRLTNEQVKAISKLRKSKMNESADDVCPECGKPSDQCTCGIVKEGVDYTGKVEELLMSLDVKFIYNDGCYEYDQMDDEKVISHMHEFNQLGYKIDSVERCIYKAE